MKIAVLSDTRLPTRRDYPGHGLGKMALAAAEGLAARGHGVTLFAGAGSRFGAGPLVMASTEDHFNDADELKDFDAILDSTHQHGLQNLLQTAAIVNWSHDREAPPGRCAVYPSAAHKAWHVARGASPTGRVIPNGVDIPQVDEPVGDYFLYLSMFHAPKGPVMAANAARLASVRLVMAGPTPPAPPVGAEYVGPVSGDAKLRLLAAARALVFPASVEAGPLVPLEAQAVGTPVICTPYGAARENVYPSAANFCGADTVELAEIIGRVRDFDEAARASLGRAVQNWVREHRSLKQMIDGFERALVDAAAGEVW